MLEIKKALVCLITLLVAILFIGIIYYSVAQQFDLWNFNVEECWKFAVACVTLAFTFCQYLDKKESNKANLLLSYNQRFMSDESVQKVITYVQYYDENKGNESFDFTSIEEPEKSEFIKFARFFEELQSFVKSNNIDKEYVCRLYAYYAVEAYINHQEKIGDIDTDESWFLFRSFCQDMMEVEKTLKIKHK